METLKPELLFSIHGIGAASGLYFRDHSLYLISDSANNLYCFNTKTNVLSRSLLIASGVPENIPKKLKPDFEAMMAIGDHLYIFGSGSTGNRNKMIVYDIPQDKVISDNDLSCLYGSMRDTARVSADDFNLEGVVKINKDWYFFQRGNGPAKSNGIFTISGKLDGIGQTIAYKEFDLGQINGSTATFTDAVTADGKIWFLATAEDSNSVYDDGIVTGSIIGSIVPETMKIETLAKISDNQKFEGIALFRETASEISFLLCEDNDTEALDSGIYKITVAK